MLFSMFGHFKPHSNLSGTQEPTKGFEDWLRTFEAQHFHDLSKAARVSGNENFAKFYEADVNFEQVLPKINRHMSMQQAQELAKKPSEVDNAIYSPGLTL